MKRLIIAVLTLICVGHLKAQDYVPFPSDSAVWSGETQTSAYSDYPTTKWLGDTLIQGELYTKCFHGSGALGNYFTYSGAVRQDTVNRKLWFINTAGEVHDLTVDFNMEAGDKFVMSPYHDHAFPFGSWVEDSLIVLAVKTSPLNGAKQYKLGWADYVVQDTVGTYTFGIGMEGIWGFEFGASLDCFSSFGKEHLGFSGPDQYYYCDIAVHVDDVESKREQIIAYPNPASGWVKIPYENTGSDIEFLVFDQLGRKADVTFQRHQDHMHVDLSNLAEGVYAFQLIQDSSFKTGVGQFMVCHSQSR